MRLHYFPALIQGITVYGICDKQATYLQTNDTHTTHWSVEYSVYMGTRYMCIKVVLELISVKDLEIADR